MVRFPESKSLLQKEIRFNMQYCQANRLNQTAKWLGELLVTVTGGDQVMSSEQEIFEDQIENWASNKIFFERPNEEVDKLNLARVLFDLKEFRKCSHMIW